MIGSRPSWLRLLSTLVLLELAISWNATTLVAQQERDASTHSAQREQRPDAANQQQTGVMGQSPDLATFNGKVFKSGNKLELQDAIGESTYQLDDQNKVKVFEGKNVKVTGIVDVVANTIYVANIEPEL